MNMRSPNPRGDPGDPMLEPEGYPVSPQNICLPANAYINCVARGLDAAACAQLCAELGAACGSIAAHPYKSGAGTGQLTWCKNGEPNFTCTYTYPNGDGCVKSYTPVGAYWICMYAGSK